MKLYIGGVELFSQRYDSFDKLTDAYREAETTAGRQVPSYSLEVLLGALAGWLLKKAGDEVWEWFWERREKEEARKKEKEQEDEAERRHQELLAALDRIAQDRTGISGHGPLPDLLTLAHGLPVLLLLETEAENDLAEAIQAKTNPVPSFSVEYIPE